MEEMIKDTDLFVAEFDESKTINIKPLDRQKIIWSVDSPDETELVLGDNFEVIQENGVYKVVNKNKRYPKTIDEVDDIECVERVGLEMLRDFGNLVKARNAYWKIYGNWKPNWDDFSPKFNILVELGEKNCDTTFAHQSLLVFPTEEIRDLFYNNFKELIEKCKDFI